MASTESSPVTPAPDRDHVPDHVPDHVKVHRRSVRLDDEQFTALSVRPGGRPPFVTSPSEPAGGWQIESDVVGARLLAQLCWAMALQRRPNTLVVLDHSRPLPIVIVNGDLGVPSDAGFAALAAMLPWAIESQGTTKLVTRGLGPASSGSVRLPNVAQRWMVEVHDVLVLSAPESALRDLAIALVRVGAGGRSAKDAARALPEFSLLQQPQSS